MRANAQERDRCRTDNAYARECFARNWFYLEENPDRDKTLNPIPKDTEFRVYNDGDKKARSKLVTIVLPPDNEAIPLLSRSTNPPEDVWKCTWFPYLGFTTPSAAGS